MSWIMFYCRIIEFVICFCISVNFIPKVWKRIRIHAKEYLEILNEQKTNNLTEFNNQDIRTKLNNVERKVTMIAKQWEDNQVLNKQQNNVIETNNMKTILENNFNYPRKDSLISGQNVKNIRSLFLTNNELHEGQYNIENEESNSDNESCKTHSKRSTVIEIAKIFERNENKSKIHMASNAFNIPENYFEGNKNCTNENDYQKDKFNEDSNEIEFVETVNEIAINKTNNLKKNVPDQMANNNFYYTENQVQSTETESKLSCNYSSPPSSSSSSTLPHANNENVIKNENYFQEAMNESLLKNFQITSGNSDNKQNIKENLSSWTQFETQNTEFNDENEVNYDDDDDDDNNVTPTNEIQLPLPSSTEPPPSTESSSSPVSSENEVKLRHQTYKNNCHDQVQTIEDILRQQRFSRRLSSYSISEFLKDFPNDIEIDEVINSIGK